ncbi:hypothetical protein AOLI_G00249860 [Acnodon oligacanthus]
MHDAAFKLKAIDLAVEEGNRAAARKLGINESMQIPGENSVLHAYAWPSDPQAQPRCKAAEFRGLAGSRGDWRGIMWLTVCIHSSSRDQHGRATDIFYCCNMDKMPGSCQTALMWTKFDSIEATQARPVVKTNNLATRAAHSAVRERAMRCGGADRDEAASRH